MTDKDKKTMLKKNDAVTFNAEGHHYENNGKSLKSVTTVLREILFPMKYAGVPEEVLNRAAERGTRIHDECRCSDMFGLTGVEVIGEYANEVSSYIMARETLKLTPIENEYLVSDGEHYAGQIDGIYTDAEGNIVIGDIKTTYKLDTEYLSWQLGFYAYLLEKQTGKKASRFIGIHIRNGECKIVPIEAKTTEDIEILIRADQGIEVMQLPAPTQGRLPATLQDVEEDICNLMNEKKRMDSKLKELQDGLYQLMLDNGVRRWDGDRLQMFIKDGTIRETLDAKALEKDHPEIDFSKYKKQTAVKSSITFKQI